MMNIREYFNNLYDDAITDMDFEKVSDYEYSVYNMEEEDFEEWANSHNIDLTAIGAHGITILQYWTWDFED